MIAWEYPPLSGVDPMTTYVGWRTKAHQTIDTAVDKAPGAHGVKVSPAVITGHPAQVLLDASAGAQLLVVENSGHGGLTQTLPGSVREHVITHATCPVLVMSHATKAELSP